MDSFADSSTEPFSAFPPESGYAFVGQSNLHKDIYPAIDAAQTPSLSHSGKTILVTGASRGLGRAIAVQYAIAGAASINLCARTESQLDDVETQITQINSSIQVHKHILDVTDVAATQALAKRITAEQGRLDILINNAGVAEPWRPIGDSDPADYIKTLDVNLKGAYLVQKAFLPLLCATAEKTGTYVNIVNVVSAGAMVLIPGSSAYGVAKLGLVRMSEFVDLEYGDKGVNVVSMHPGGVETSLSDGHAHVKKYLVDTAELCGGFTTWLTAQDRKWLNGRYTSVNWDVDVLDGMKEEIVKGDKLKVKLTI